MSKQRRPYFFSTSQNLLKFPKRWREKNTDNAAIFRGMMTVMAFVFIAKLAAAAKEMLVAWRYGTSGVVDGYLYVYNLAQWPIGIWFSVLSVVLIPLVGRTRADKDGGLTKFRNELFGAVIIGGIILSVVVAVVTCTMLRLGITGLDGDALQAARDMALILATSAFFGALIAFFSTWVMAGNRHENTLFEGIPAVCIAVTVIIFSEAEGGALLWGTMVGVVLQATMQLYSLRWKKEMPIPRFTRESPLWGPFVRQLGIMFVGQALLSTTIIIDTVAAAHMGPGAIATLGYANRVVALIISLGAIAVSRATLPIFSAPQNSQDPKRIATLAATWSSIMLIGGGVALIIGWFFSEALVRLLFERGAFVRGDTEAVSEVFRWYLIQIPWYFPSLVLMSVLAAAGRYWSIAAIGLTMMIFKLILLILLLPAQGLLAIPMATAGMLFLMFILMRFAVYKLRRNE